MCDHDLDYVDIRTELHTPGIIAYAGCSRCGARLRKRVPRDGPTDEYPVAEHFESDDWHVLVEPESLGVGGTEGAWIKSREAPTPLEMMI